MKSLSIAALFFVLALHGSASGQAAKPEVIWIEGRITSVTDATEAEIDAAQRAGSTAIPFIVKLDHVHTLLGDFKSAHATVVLPIATLLVNYRNVWVYVVLTKNADGTMYTIAWDYLDLPTCFPRAFAKANGLEETTLQLRREGRLIWTPNCSW